MNEAKEIFHKEGLELPLEEATKLLEFGIRGVVKDENI
jgi:hypothetical protein